MASSAEIAQNASVVDKNGRSVGRVIAVEYTHLVVEQGFLFTKTLYLPMSAIVRVDGATASSPGRVHLNIDSKRVGEIGKNTPNEDERSFIGASTDTARFAKMGPTATAGLNPKQHTPDDFAAPSSYGDPYNGGDQFTDDIVREGVPTLHGNPPDDRTISEQAQIARRPLKKQ